MIIPDEIMNAARLITKWAKENNVTRFAIAGIQQRNLEGQDFPLSEWCDDYDCPGDCGMRHVGRQ